MSAKRAWDETWRYDDVHVLMGGPEPIADERERLAAAAPELARALLMRRMCTEPEGKCQQCSVAAERALAKAGIPLP